MMEPAPAGRRRVAEVVVVLAIIAVVIGGGYVLLQQRVANILSNVTNSVGGSAATPASGGVSAQCRDQMTNLTNALEELDSRLSIGMNFSAYSDKVAAAKVAYDKLPSASLDSTCLALVGTPEENALNEYISAYTTWNACVSKTGCTNDSISTELQAHWTTATTLIEGAKRALP